MLMRGNGVPAALPPSFASRRGTSSPASSQQVSVPPLRSAQGPARGFCQRGEVASRRKRDSRATPCRPPGHLPPAPPTSTLRVFPGESQRSRRGLAVSPQRPHCAVGRPGHRGGFGPWRLPTRCRCCPFALTRSNPKCLRTF